LLLSVGPGADSGVQALSVERQSARKSTTKNGRLASLASNPLVTVLILELWAKWVKSYLAMREFDTAQLFS